MGEKRQKRVLFEELELDLWVTDISESMEQERLQLDRQHLSHYTAPGMASI